jgi:hypothetical protein
VFLSFAREKLGGLVFVEGEAAFFMETPLHLFDRRADNLKSNWFWRSRLWLCYTVSG